MSQDENFAGELKIITAAPVRLKVATHQLPVSSDDLEITVLANWVLRNPWYYRDAEKPDVMITGYTLESNGGSGDVDVSYNFFSSAKREFWEAELAQKIEAYDRDIDTERGVA
jgi:hypothetical protein